MLRSVNVSEIFELSLGVGNVDGTPLLSCTKYRLLKDIIPLLWTNGSCKHGRAIKQRRDQVKLFGRATNPPCQSLIGLDPSSTPLMGSKSMIYWNVCSEEFTDSVENMCMSSMMLSKKSVMYREKFAWRPLRRSSFLVPYASYICLWILESCIQVRQHQQSSSTPMSRRGTALLYYFVNTATPVDPG